MRKKNIIGIIRWVLFITLTIIGLLDLNHAAFSSWSSWGPPTKYQHAWAQEALLHFGYSTSLLATAIMALVAVRPGYDWRLSKIKYFWIAVVVLGMGYPRIKEQILIDKCMDSGGAWSKEYFECQK